FDKLGLTGGAGYAWQDRPSGDDDGVTYLIGGYYDLFPGTRIHVSHSHLIRFPTLRDLFEPGRANPDLESEKTDHYEAGIRHEFSQFPAGLGITVFRIEAEDFIETDSNGVAQNVEEDRFEGVEITAEARPLESLDLRGAYTYLESRNLSAGVTNRDLQNRPQHQLSVETVYQFPWDMYLYLAWLHIEGSLDLSRQAPIKSRETGDYDVFDLKIDKSFGNVSIYARALNLLDEDYVESAGFPAPGRTVLIGGELSFGK
ncbi:MAG: TonB-dependent receptor domain-containing protein, partial [Gammaproteobacteria bacterium]